MKKNIILILYSILIFSPLLFSKGMISHVDMTFPMLPERLSDNIFTTWVDSSNFDNIGNLARSYVLIFLWLFSEFFKLIPLDVLTRIFFVIPFIIYIVYSYLFAERVAKINEKRINLPILLAITGITFSSWVLDHAWTFYIWFGFTGIVACFYYITKGIDEIKFSTILACAPFLIIASFSPHTALLSIILAGSFFLISFIYEIKKRLFIIKYSFLYFFIFFLLNSFWILPYLQLTLLHGGLAPEYLPNPGLIQVLASNNLILNLLTLNGGWNASNFIDLSTTNFLSYFQLTLPFIFSLVILLSKKNPLLITAYFLGFLGIFMASGPLMSPIIYNYLAFDSPLSGPLGWALRSSDRWLALYLIIFPVLIGTLYPYLSKIEFKLFNFIKIKGFYFTYLVSILIILGNMPNLLISYHEHYAPIIYPTDYRTALSGEKSRNNSLVLPYYSLGGYKSNWSERRLGDYTQQNLTHSITEVDFDSRFFSGFIYSLLKNNPSFKHVAVILDTVGIDKIYYDKTLIREENDVFSELNYLSIQSEISKIFSSKTIDIYNSSLASSLIYTTGSATLTFAGHDLLKYLADNNDIDKLKNSAIYFMYDLERKNFNLSSYKKIILTDSDNITNLVVNNSIIELSKYVVGGDPTKDNWVSDVYTDGITKRIFDTGIMSYEKAISPRFIYTYHNAKLVVNTDTNTDKTYKVFLKYLPNIGGGAMKISIGTTTISLSTKEINNRFVWKEIYEGKITNKQISIESLNGFNVLDVIGIVPTDEYDDRLARVNGELSSKNIEYFFRIPYDFNYYTHSLDTNRQGLLITKNNYGNKNYYESPALIFKNISLRDYLTNNLIFNETNKTAVNSITENKNSENFYTLQLDFKPMDIDDEKSIFIASSTLSNIINVSAVVNFSTSTGKEWVIIEPEKYQNGLLIKFPKKSEGQISSLHLWYICKSEEKFCGINFNNIKIIDTPTEISKTIDILFSKKYSLIISADGNIEIPPIIKLDGNVFYGEKFNNHFIYSLNSISKGTHLFEIEANKGLILNGFLLKESTQNQDGYSTNIIKEIINEDRNTKYKITFEKNHQDFDLILAKRFSSLWTAVDNNGNIILPKKAFSLVTGFHVPQNATEITITFLPQKTFKFGLVISLITFLFCISYLIYKLIIKKSKIKSL